MYSFHLFNLNFTQHPILQEKWISQKPITIRLNDPRHTLMELSNPYETNNYITYMPDRELYHEFYEWSTCDMYGCTMNCTEGERQALVDFFNATQGSWWRINENWGEGDPCLNHWYGIICNTMG